MTVNASSDESLQELRKIERRFNLDLTILAICTTGITAGRIKEIMRHADIVWSCASGEVRSIIGPKAILQLSKKIPVFVLTRRGIRIVSSYCSDKNTIESLNLKK